MALLKVGAHRDNQSQALDGGVKCRRAWSAQFPSSASSAWAQRRFVHSLFSDVLLNMDLDIVEMKQLLRFLESAFCGN